MICNQTDFGGLYGQAEILSARPLPEGPGRFSAPDHRRNLPARVDLFRVAAHYAVFALFREKACREARVQGIALEMDRFFGHHNYTMDHLFGNERRLVLERICEQSAAPFLETCRTFSENSAPLMEYLAEKVCPFPMFSERLFRCHSRASWKSFSDKSGLISTS